MTFPSGGNSWNPLPGDFNGDGRLDIASGNWIQGTVSILLSQPQQRSTYADPH
jgi:hypothetical protein